MIGDRIIYSFLYPYIYIYTKEYIPYMKNRKIIICLFFITRRFVFQRITRSISFYNISLHIHSSIEIQILEQLRLQDILPFELLLYLGHLFLMVMEDSLLIPTLNSIPVINSFS